jgi:hypothetical protein
VLITPHKLMNPDTGVERAPLVFFFVFLLLVLAQLATGAMNR